MEKRSGALESQVINKKIMTEFTSDIKTLPYSDKKIYEVLSNMSNLEKVKDKISHEKAQDITFNEDSCTFSVNPVGEVSFSIIEREPPKTIKFKADQTPIDVNMWIQLKESGENETKMKITIRAELNPFLKPMISKPLKKGIDQIAEILAAVPYDEI